MTQPADPPIRYFQPGVPGPGRKKGSRNKVATSFFDDLYRVWEELGEATMRRAAFQEPMAFSAMVAKLMPQKIEISTPTDGLSDERFEQLLDLADRMSALASAKAEQGMISAPMTIDGQAYEVSRGEGAKDEKALGGEGNDVIHTSAFSPDRNLGPDSPDRLSDFTADQNLEPAHMRDNTVSATSEEAIRRELLGEPAEETDRAARYAARTSIHRPDVPLGEVDPDSLF